MPIIQMNNPFADGANAANTWAQGQNDAKAKALALAHQKAIDDQAQANTDRDYQFRKTSDQQTQARADKVATHDIARDDAQTKIAQDADRRAQELEPLIRKQYVAQINSAGDEHKARTAELAGQLLKNKLDAITAQYGPQMAQAALAQARASVARDYASIAHENAATAHENAETGLTQQYTRNLGEGLSKTGAPRGGSESRMEAGITDRQNLPPEVGSLLDDVESGKRSRSDVLREMATKPNLRAYAKQVAHLMSVPGVIGRPSASDRQNATAAAAGVYNPKDQALKARKAFQGAGLPPEIQEGVLGEIAKGVSLDSIAQSIGSFENLKKKDGTPRYDPAIIQKALGAVAAMGGPEVPAPPRAQSGGFDMIGALRSFAGTLGLGGATHPATGP